MSIKLPLEKQFQIQSEKLAIDQMSGEQARDYCKRLIDYNAALHDLVLSTQKKSLGIDASPIGTDGIYDGPINNEGV